MDSNALARALQFRVARMASGLTGPEAAAILGVSTNNLRQWETLRRAPSDDALDAMTVISKFAEVAAREIVDMIELADVKVPIYPAYEMWDGVDGPDPKTPHRIGQDWLYNVARIASAMSPGVAIEFCGWAGYQRRATRIVDIRVYNDMIDNLAESAGRYGTDWRYRLDLIAHGVTGKFPAAWSPIAAAVLARLAEFDGEGQVDLRQDDARRPGTGAGGGARPEMLRIAATIDDDESPRDPREPTPA